MFLHVSVILSTGGVWQADTTWQADIPPGRQTPPWQADTPPGRQTPPWADTPGQTPPWADTPQGTVTAAYGTHPTGMHSCSVSSIQ